MTLRPPPDGMDSTMDGGTCVLVLSEKSSSIKQYKEQPKNVYDLDHVAKVIVSTETHKHMRGDENRQINIADSAPVSEGVDIYVPMLTSVPKDFSECPPRGIFQGYVHTMKSIMKLKDQYETMNSSRFILYARSNAFGDGDWMEGKHRVAWEIAPNSRPGVSLPFQGIPFFIVGHAIYDCQHGRRRKPSKKTKREVVSPEAQKKRKVQQQNSIKIGCPAQLLMREVIMFPEFKLASDTLKRRQLMSQRVRKGIQLHNEGKDMVRTERRIYVYFPHPEEHQHRVNKVNSNGIARSVEPVDPKIVKKIHTLVSQGVTGTKKIREHVDDFVREMFQDSSPPPADRRRYNPSDQDIRNAMKKAQAEMRKAKRKAMELQCASLMHGIREQLSVVKSEKYLMQLKDHLVNLHLLVQNEESLEPLSLCPQVNDDNKQQSQPCKKMKVRHLKEELIDTATEITEPPTQTIFTTEYNGPEDIGPQEHDKTINLKPEHMGSLIEIPAATGAPSYAYSNNYESGEPNQIIYQEEVPHSQESHVEGVTQIYYYQKIPSQSDIYAISNQADCNQVPYSLTEFMKDPLN